MTFGEVYEGIYGSTDPRATEAAFRRFVRSVRVVPLNRRIMQRFGRIRRELRDLGRLIDAPDILIAATAIEHDLVLVTRNLSDFERVPDLKLYDPN